MRTPFAHVVRIVCGVMMVSPVPLWGWVYSAAVHPKWTI